MPNKSITPIKQKTRRHGGRRPGAGRKRLPDLSNVRTYLSDSLSAEKWDGIAQSLYEHACNGNVHAAELLIMCRFGGPDAPPAPEPVEQIKIIEYLPYDSVPPGQPIEPPNRP